MNILVLNAGSSSLKFEIVNEQWQRRARGEVECIGGNSNLTIQYPTGETKHVADSIRDARAAVDLVLREAVPPSESIHAAGHRVVHGGERFRNSALITPEVLDDIRDCIELAPLHNPANIRGIEAVQSVLGASVPQVAVFDTSFHQQLPEYAYLYALPYSFYEGFKVRRYGFHGTSYRYLWSRYLALSGKSAGRAKIIALHLGNGCSVCAIDRGRPIDTSMGFTPLEGLMMGSRTGDLDPSVVAFLSHKLGRTADEIEGILNHESGLLGVSGLTNDMRDLLNAAGEQGNPRAQLAIEMFCYRARKYIGAYLAALGGADALIFSAGVGEHAAEVRAKICQNLGWCGLTVDASRNATANGKEAIITTPDSAVTAWVIPTDEELMIAQDTYRITQAQRGTV
jgi:acetate kinase